MRDQNQNPLNVSAVFCAENNGFSCWKRANYIPVNALAVLENQNVRRKVLKSEVLLKIPSSNPNWFVTLILATLWGLTLGSLNVFQYGNLE